jgi:BRO1-like domain
LERYDLKEPLTRWLDGSSQPGSPMEYVALKPRFRSQQCQKELTRLASLRKCLSDAITKSESHKHALDDFALQDCHEYHAALLAFEKQGFPTRDQESNLELTWGASMSSQKEKHGSLVWDRVCTLWNIAALESFLGANQGQDKDGRKQAVKHFQHTSACLRHLQKEVEGQNFETVDMRKSFLQFWESVMLAQAQISAYEMAASTPGKHAILSYLAMGAVPILNDALNHAKDPFIVSNLPKPISEWAAQCKGQSMILSASAEYHQAVDCRENKNWGMEIARLDKAQSYLQECISFLKSSKLELVSAESLVRRVQDRMVQAVKDNKIYGDDIPKILPEIPGKLLVKNEVDMPDTMLKPKVPLFEN